MSYMGLGANQQWIPQTILLGLINHLYFHRFEPKSATLPLLLLAVQPLALLVILGVPISYTSVPVAYLTFIASLCSSIVIYRISPWHPLAEFPGPMVNKISKIWGAWISVDGGQHRVNKRLHDIYGPFVRTGPNEISVIHVDAIKSVLGSGGFPKGQYYDTRVDPTLPTVGLLILRGEAHTRRRRIWNRGMNSESIQEYEPILAQRVAQLVGRLESFTDSASVDISKWISFFTFDFMGDMAFGGGFEMLRDGGDQDGLWTVIEKGAKMLALISQLPWIAPTLTNFPSPGNRLRRFGATCATNRIKAGSKVKDLWYHLTDEAGLEKKKPTVGEAVSDGVLAIVAGADTTSSALSSFLWCVLSNPDIYRRVQAEVDTVYPDEESVSDTSKHADLHLLTACLNETLRLFPPVLTNGPRQAKEGKLVAGRFVPGGTQIFIPLYSIHRNPQYFSPSPEKFDPDRWLRPSTPDSVLNLTAFIPFSYGAANCVGKSLAWREMLLVSSTLIRKFNISFAKDGFDSAIWPDKLQDYFITSIEYPLLVTLSRR